MPDTHSLEQPILVFDGECGFCRIWMERWKELTGDRVAYRPFQDVGETFHGATRKQFASAVGFVGKDGVVSFGALAVFRLCADGIGKKRLLWSYRRVPGFKQVTEFAYRIIASHRRIAYHVTKLLWGKPAPKSTFRVASNLGLRLVGLVFVIAFWSLRDQIVLLVGQGGLLPFSTGLQTYHAEVGGSAYLHAPTLLWFANSDQALRGLATVGAIAGFFVLIDVLALPALLVCYACYLSLFTVGQEFMAFQWDLLLLEAGFLSLLLAYVRRFKPAPSDPFAWVAWLFRWLTFRLFFLSGLAKILSGDPTWANLTALSYHYETQPLPTPLAWYAFHLPLWFQKVTTWGTLFIELVVPFFIFAPRRLRHAAAYILIAFQVAIALTGNYGFFNLLSIVLCVFLFDDAWFARCSPKRILQWLTRRIPRRTPSRRTRIIIGLLVGALVVLSVMRAVESYVPSTVTYFEPILFEVSPFAIVNEYGLFSVMTRTRPEVVIEGSDDGVTWKEYRFGFKPGNDLNAAPTFSAPYLSRLDWQMWFAALSTYQQNAWFLPLMTQLLNGHGYARFLFAENPFPVKPPQYVRAMMYIYHFSPTHDGGAWWTRELQGYYFPPVTLNDLQTL